MPSFYISNEYHVFQHELIAKELSVVCYHFIQICIFCSFSITIIIFQYGPTEVIFLQQFLMFKFFFLRKTTIQYSSENIREQKIPIILMHEQISRYYLKRFKLIPFTLYSGSI